MQRGVKDVIATGEQNLSQFILTHVARQRIHVQVSRADQSGDVRFISELMEIGQPGVLGGQHEHPVNSILRRDDVDQHYSTFGSDSLSNSLIRVS